MAESYLAQLIQRDARVMQIERLARSYGPQCFLLGFGPRAAPDENGGPVCLTVAREAVHPARCMAALNDVRPLAGPAEIVKVQAGAHHSAIDDLRRHHSQLAAGRARHRLVEQPRSLGNLCLACQHKPLERESQGLQVQIAMTAADLVHQDPVLVDDVPIAGRLFEERRREREPSVLRTLGLGLEEAPRLSQPALSGSELEPDGVMDAEHEGYERCPAWIPQPQVVLVGALVCRERVLVAIGPKS